MYKLKLLLFFSVLATSFSSLTQLHAQGTPTVPKGFSVRNGRLLVSIPVGDAPTNGSQALFDSGSTSTMCAQIPTMDQANQTDDNFYSLTTTEAASLKIQFPIAGGGGNGSGDSRVFMRQYKRYATCTAPNGDILEYGQAIRASVVYSSTALGGNVSFPLVVANATINKQSTQIDIQNTGFTDTTVTTPRSAAIASLSNGSLSIDNYGTFMSKLNEAMSAADVSTSTVTGSARSGFSATPVLLGREVSLASGDTALADSLAKAFAINYIAGGYGCNQAQDDFSKTDPHSRQIVIDTYKAITGNCGAPNQLDKVKASMMLRGMTVTKPRQS